MPKPTERKLLLLRAIASCWEQHGYGPTLRELGEVTGMKSASTVVYWLDKMERDGFLIRPALADGEHLTRALRLSRLAEAILNAESALLDGGKSKPDVAITEASQDAHPC